MRINIDKLIFWIVFVSLLLSVINNENERINNTVRLESIEIQIKALNLRFDIELEKFKTKYFDHTHYYNWKPKEPQNKYKYYKDKRHKNN